MSREEEKAQQERKVFEEFTERSDLPIRLKSIGSRRPPEPDILCEISGEGYVAFELKGITDEAIKKAVSRQLKNPSKTQSGWVGIPLDAYMRRARKKTYETAYPMELLFYTDGAGHTLDEIVHYIRVYFKNNLHKFRRVWFMGWQNETCKRVVDRSDVIE